MLRVASPLRISVPELEMENYWFWIYAFAACVGTIGSALYYKSINQEITGGLLLVGFIGFSFYFGMKWFSPARRDITSVTTWPPIVNYCPDFLSLYNINNKQVCVDTIGVARTGGIKRWTSPTQTDESYFFDLFLDSGKDRVAKLCKQAKDKQVTWEGVWDGTICTAKNEPPLPPPVQA